LYEDPAPLPVREGALNLWPIVGRALQKDAAQRYHTMGELVAALEALRDSSDSASTLEAFRQLQPAPSVAVLPFKNLSADPENRYFSEGLTEDLAHELSMVAGLRLVSRASAHQFTADADPREVGRRLNVGTVVEGTVRTSGGRMRITAQLVNVADGFHLWSGRWDREIGDILEVQDEISRAIAERLVEQLRPAGGRAAGPRAPVHPEAYEHYLRGRYHLNQWTPASIDRAAECFRRTIELDGSLGPAWLGLARSYLHKATLGFDLPRPILEQGLQAAQKAVDLMPERPVALTIAAVCMGLLEWDWMPARQTVEAAFARDPKDPLVQGWYCEIVLLPQGRFDEALAATAEEGENEGLVLPARMRPGWLPLWRRQPEETLASVARSIAVAPAILAPYWIQALAWETLGRLPEAAESLRRALQLDPASTLSQGLLARLLAQQGQMAEAREVIGGLEALRKERYVAPSHLSWGCIAVGDFDRAFALLHEAMDQRDFLALFLETHPMYDPLRGDARYGALKARLSVRHPDAGSVGQSSL
jgi:TolB-like protein